MRVGGVHADRACVRRSVGAPAPAFPLPLLAGSIAAEHHFSAAPFAVASACGQRHCELAAGRCLCWIFEWRDVRQVVSRDASGGARRRAYARAGNEKLEHRGWVASEWGQSEGGRRVKIYRLTKAGRKQLRAEEDAWQKATGTVARFFRIRESPL